GTLGERTRRRAVALRHGRRTQRPAHRSRDGRARRRSPPKPEPSHPPGWSRRPPGQADPTTPHLQRIHQRVPPRSLNHPDNGQTESKSFSSDAPPPATPPATPIADPNRHERVAERVSGTHRRDAVPDRPVARP